MRPRRAPAIWRSTRSTIPRRPSPVTAIRRRSTKRSTSTTSPWLRTGSDETEKGNEAMGKTIVIAGAGHAAMMCGATLAKNGYDVTVYERRKREDVGYPWFDCVNPDIFHMVG
ncbi:MAG: NAD(P)-binding protein, partial [Clostridia bacterium]|nr:NAD(P)-binding protein [Clostridia bacterium]